jgi:Reverse transcriptase (RNA-dependent DNA polymerase)
MNIVRILFSVTINHGWNLYQMDVKNIFLQGTLEEDVYMTLPPGHELEKNYNLACRLKSTTGFCTFVDGNLVTWRSKK